MTETAKTPPFGVGAVLYVPAADYLYGTDPLALRVTEVEVDPAQHSAMEWVNVRGVPIHWNGATGDERYAMIRVAAIKGALRPHVWLPPQRSSDQLARRDAGSSRSP
jgi:hypothetical protein